MKINYLLGLPTFLMIIGLAWASQSHANWGHSYDENDDLPEVESLLQDSGPRSSFDLGSEEKADNIGRGLAQDHNVLELVKKFDAMQYEVQELRGRLDTQDHELKLLRNQQLSASQAIQKAANPSASLNSNSQLELKSSGITYKPAGT